MEFAPGTLVILIGPAGSGKTTYTLRFPDTWRVSLDAYRRLATDDAADQTATPTAAQIQALLLDARLARGLTTIADSTNVHTHVRAGLLARARYYHRPVTAVLFTVPRVVCEQRNAARDRRVPVDVIRTQDAHRPTREQLRDEGFTDIRIAPRTTAPLTVAHR
ncbi:AAA family ATPase [Streptomyces benahoarensis]|uniref:AAA family ATPase n=1 Tax=Streptomyces benahoarensis TaxID=2595054 RepID=A0A553Z5Q3_9ACTN|nr:AAA family ATPase [Streptomyces benahoarensis]TSB19453.1 AAA family ATPase [Streptomyces benahoarensis]TSB36774.1 AAA family ATPase [Streptomyces benahoarensis]